jgi:hypothetical protein
MNIQNNDILLDWINEIEKSSIKELYNKYMALCIGEIITRLCDDSKQNEDDLEKLKNNILLLTSKCKSNIKIDDDIIFVILNFGLVDMYEHLVEIGNETITESTFEIACTAYIQSPKLIQFIIEHLKFIPTLKHFDILVNYCKIFPNVEDEKIYYLISWFSKLRNILKLTKFNIHSKFYIYVSELKNIRRKLEEIINIFIEFGGKITLEYVKKFANYKIEICDLKKYNIKPDDELINICYDKCFNCCYLKNIEPTQEQLKKLFASRNIQEIKRILRGKKIKFDINNLRLACKVHSIGIVRFLLSKKIKPDVECLRFACDRRYRELINLLLEVNVKPDLDCVESLIVSSKDDLLRNVFESYKKMINLLFVNILIV